MHTTSLRKVGGSVMLAVPPALLEALRLQAGGKVGIEVQGGRLVIEPKRRPRYALKDLLKECQPKARRSREEREWLSSKPVGRELL